MSTKLEAAMKAIGAKVSKGNKKYSPTASDIHLMQIYTQGAIDQVDSGTSWSKAKAKRLYYANNALKYLDKKSLSGFDKQAKSKGCKNLEALLKKMK